MLIHHLLLLTLVLHSIVCVTISPLGLSTDLFAFQGLLTKFFFHVCYLLEHDEDIAMILPYIIKVVWRSYVISVSDIPCLNSTIPF